MPIQPTKTTVQPDVIAASKRMSCFPVPNFTVRLISQPFGVNYVGGGFYPSMGYLGHPGTDIAVPVGTDTLCVFDHAEVTFVGFSPVAGNIVEIATTGFTVPGFSNPLRLIAYYGHLLRPLVSIGDKVVSGDKIALSGNTGSGSSGPHIHYGIKPMQQRNGTWVPLDQDNGFKGWNDPEAFFPATVEHYLYPVDNRYNLPISRVAEAYKVMVTPWLQMKLRRAPTARELHAFGYGKWPYEVVIDPARFVDWTQMTLPAWKKKLQSMIGR